MAKSEFPVPIALSVLLALCRFSPLLPFERFIPYTYSVAPLVLRATPRRTVESTSYKFLFPFINSNLEGLT